MAVKNLIIKTCFTTTIASIVIILAFYISYVHVISTTLQTTTTTTATAATTTTTRSLQTTTPPHQNNNKHLPIPSRSWSLWQSSHPYTPWCVLKDKNDNKKTTPQIPRGLIYVRIPKTGSTTLAGIIMRIARRHAISLPNNDNSNNHRHHPHCEHYWKHTPANDAYLTKDPHQSFILASLRDPTSRALSQVFFRYMTKKRHDVHDDDFIIEKLKELSVPEGEWRYVNRNYLRDATKMAGYQMGYTYLRRDDDDSSSSLAVYYTGSMEDAKAIFDWESQIVSHILSDYDFLIVTERMNESLVALQFLLGLDVRDILYLRTNVSGDSYRYDGSSCRVVEKIVISPRVSSYVKSEEWLRRISGDVLLWKAANKSLDDTIRDVIGRETFDIALDRFEKLLMVAEEECASSAQWRCLDGVYDPVATGENCEDETGFLGTGCAFQCLDDVLDTAI